MGNPRVGVQPHRLLSLFLVEERHAREELLCGSSHPCVPGTRFLRYALTDWFHRVVPAFGGRNCREAGVACTAHERACSTTWDRAAQRVDARARIDAMGRKDVPRPPTRCKSTRREAMTQVGVAQATEGPTRVLMLRESTVDT